MHDRLDDASAFCSNFIWISGAGNAIYRKQPRLSAALLLKVGVA